MHNHTLIILLSSTPIMLPDRPHTNGRHWIIRPMLYPMFIPVVSSTVLHYILHCCSIDMQTDYTLDDSTTIFGCQCTTHSTADIIGIPLDVHISKLRRQWVTTTLSSGHLCLRLDDFLHIVDFLHHNLFICQIRMSYTQPTTRISEFQ